MVQFINGRREVDGKAFIRVAEYFHQGSARIEETSTVI